jgi:hypothetical protein
MGFIVLQISALAKAAVKAAKKYGPKLPKNAKSTFVKMGRDKDAFKRELRNAIEKRTSPATYTKKLTKEQRYQQAIEDSYKKQGGTMKYKTGGMTNPNKKAAVNPKGPKGKMGYGMKMTGLKKMGKKK